MNPGAAVATTGVVVTAGRWSSGQPVSMRIVVGGTVLALGLSVANESVPDLASKFATLVLAVALFTYLPPIAWKVGLLDHAKYPNPPKWV